MDEKKIHQQVYILAVSFLMLAAVTLAWFINSNIADTQGMGFETIDIDFKAELYEWTNLPVAGDEDTDDYRWVYRGNMTTENDPYAYTHQFAGWIPGRTVYFKIVLTSSAKPVTVHTGIRISKMEGYPGPGSVILPTLLDEYTCFKMDEVTDTDLIPYIPDENIPAQNHVDEPELSETYAANSVYSLAGDDIGDSYLGEHGYSLGANETKTISFIFAFDSQNRDGEIMTEFKGELGLQFVVYG